ncbi:hypothetical protein [Granulicella sibirica]|uniref:Uncharacterized protein n=1 Tax=Granulicella sibirica TaxID=2479048 RepID=A0A4Q0SW80_9BACT|nr:hypothetical protein [Granulicella sibirica]RXH54682.1 hypothetical protein GRAN_3786 [Granulicella sibirica]
MDIRVPLKTIPDEFPFISQHELAAGMALLARDVDLEIEAEW